VRTAEVELEEPMLTVNYEPTTSCYAVERGRVAVKLDAGSAGVNELMEVATGG
jgi:hypothetical protein